jgi:hypothetical protein
MRITDTKTSLTAARLRKILRYDPKTGIFRWRISPVGIVPAGSVAGTVKPKNGYRLIGIGRRYFLAHRLAWLYVHGEWPPGRLDHKDTNGDHNWIGNLRPATQVQNCGNRTISRHNTSGYKGVSHGVGRYSKDKWRARIQMNGKRLFLGNYDTPQEAHAAYVKKARELYGEFANGG